MTKLLPSPNDRPTRLIVSIAIGLLVSLVTLFSLLAASGDDSDRDGSSGRCAPAVEGTVDPVTCLPGSSTGAAAANTNNSGSGTQQPKASTAKPPAAPKAPAAPAPKAPAPPPVRLTK
ncbi:hypothetical protein [Streptomyces sp. NPDC015125]|uniref:hypothetical protein n=1 Tax=Streptomyces sp. NPDC015125 TaxID=3364938 RepID=UPI00370300A7